MKIAKSWDEVSIGQFQQLQKLNEPTYENQILTLAILTGKDIDHIEDLPTVTIEKLLAGLDWMAELPQPKEIKQFRRGNYVYRFAASRHDITAGQFITVQDLFSAGDWIGQLHNIMAALAVKYRLFLPKRIEIKAKDFDSTAQVFKDTMPISLAYGYALFFSAYLPKVLEATQVYLDEMVKELKETANGQD